MSRRIGHRSIKSSAFIEPVFEDTDVTNGGPLSPPIAERRRLKQAQRQTHDAIRRDRFSEHQQQRIAENNEIHSRGLNALRGDIEGPHIEDRKQAAALDAEHKRLTGGRF